MSEIADRPLLKVLAKDKGRDVDEFLELAGTMLGDRASITHSSSIGLLEIAAPGVTKATGLAEVAATHGIAPHEVAAIGDMPNDVPMLRWAGRLTQSRTRTRPCVLPPTRSSRRTTRTPSPR